jgi:transposase-like protein
MAARHVSGAACSRCGVQVWGGGDHSDVNECVTIWRERERSADQRAIRLAQLVRAYRRSHGRCDCELCWQTCALGIQTCPDCGSSDFERKPEPDDSIGGPPVWSCAECHHEWGAGR